MDRAIRAEALNPYGVILAGTAFKFYVDGRLFASVEHTNGSTTFQLDGPFKKLEVRAEYRGESHKVRVAEDADMVRILFDPGREPPEAPAVVNKRDPQRGRWGGLAEAQGRKLSAILVDSRKSDFSFDLVIQSTDGSPLVPPVRFHLHDSLARSRQVIRKLNRDRTCVVWKEVRVDRAFVVGAQVRDASGHWIGLELDLNMLEGLPESFKDPEWIRAMLKENGEKSLPNPADAGPKGPTGPGKPRKEVPWMTRLNANGQLQPIDMLRLQKILRDLFSLFDMSNLLLGVNRNVANYAPIGGRLPEVIQAVVQSANMELWWGDLVSAARLARPSAPQLQAFAQEFGLAMLAADMSSGVPVIVEGRALEEIVRPNVPLFDISVFRSRMGEIEGRVCRIECPALNPLGTGFLVGPDTIITNYHVVEKLISGAGGAKWSPRDLVARFDFKVGPDGATVSKGSPFRLAADWLIDSSSL